jgi:hypothetical protein
MNMTNGAGFNLNSKRGGGIPLGAFNNEAGDGRTISSTKTHNGN